jgi:hypothetical protein
VGHEFEYWDKYHDFFAGRLHDTLSEEENYTCHSTTATAAIDMIALTTQYLGKYDALPMDTDHDPVSILFSIQQSLSTSGGPSAKSDFDLMPT